MAATATVIALQRPTFDLDVARARIAEATTRLDEVFTDLGIEPPGPPAVATSVDDLDELLDRICASTITIVLQATFTDASVVVHLAEKSHGRFVIWSFPEPRTGERLRLNSLCGSNLAAFSLRRRFHDATFVHVDPSADDATDRIRAAIERVDVTCMRWPAVPHAVTPEGERGAARIAERVEGARIGVVGDAPCGFEPCEYNDHELTGFTGVIAEPVPLAALFAAADRTTASELDQVAVRVRNSLDVAPDVEEYGLADSLRLYRGLSELVAEHDWSAVASRCWPECFTEYGGALCAPQAMVSAGGIPAICEADLYGAVTSLVLSVHSDGAPFVADLVDVDRTDNTSTMWHCGVASLDLAQPGAPRRGILHPNHGRALLHQFPLRAGRVTVARLSRAGGRTSMVIGSGEMLPRPRAFAGTCGVLRWDLPVDDVVSTIFSFGVEHHYGIAYGEQRDALVALAARWQIPVIRLGHDEATTAR